MGSTWSPTGEFMIVCITHSYNDIGNIDLDTFDLEKLAEDHPYRLAVEKALKNSFRVGVLDNSERVFEGELGDALNAARVPLPAMVSDAVHLRVRD